MRKNTIFVFLCFFVLLMKPVFGIDVEVSSSLSSNFVVQGRDVILNVRVVWVGAPDDIQLSALKGPSCFLLEATKSKQNNLFKMYADKNLNIISIEYTLKATEPGAGRVSYVPIEYTDKSTGAKKLEKTQPFDVKVLSKKQYFIKKTLTILIIIVVIGLAAVSFFALRHYYKLKKNQLKAGRFEDIDLLTALESQALSELKTARKYKLSGETDKFFDSIVNILSGYFERRYGLDFGKTGQPVEFKADEIIPQKVMLDYKDICAVTNKIKFSGEKLSSEEMERWYKQAEKIVLYFIDKSREDELKKINNLDKEKF